MPTVAQLRTFIVGTIIPPIAGALGTWLASTQVFGVFHITANAAVAEITQIAVFGVVTGLTWLTNHHILKASSAGKTPLETTYL
jgi:hypothetical protein